MISPEYCIMMAQYNQWQNNDLRDIVDVMDEDALRLDRGAYFGSIIGTLNHLMAGDMLWMNRFDPSFKAPAMGADKGISLTAGPSDWSAERLRVDGVINEWAHRQTAANLAGEFLWYSTVYDQEFTSDKALCVVHFFNHQTHHRGQIHAMMTAAGQSPIDTDLPLMPES